MLNLFDVTTPTVTDDGVDLGLETELAANRRQRASLSSSATWDSVSVDSLAIYDVEEATAAVQTAALYSARAEPPTHERAASSHFTHSLYHHSLAILYTTLIWESIKHGLILG